MSAINDSLFESHPDAKAYLAAFLSLYGGEASHRGALSLRSSEEDMMRYWVQLSSLEKNGPFHFKQCLFMGLVAVRNQGQLPSNSTLRSSKRIIQYNNAVCYFKLGQFTESRNLFEEIKSKESNNFAKEFKRLSASLHTKFPLLNATP